MTAPWQVIALNGMVFGIGAGLAAPPPVGVMLTRRFPNRTGFANAATITGLGPGTAGYHRRVVPCLGGCGMAGGLYLARHREPYIGTVYLLGPAGTRRHRCGAPGGASHLWIIRAILRMPYFWLLISV